MIAQVFGPPRADHDDDDKTIAPEPLKPEWYKEWGVPLPTEDEWECDDEWEEDMEPSAPVLTWGDEPTNGREDRDNTGSGQPASWAAPTEGDEETDLQ